MSLFQTVLAQDFAGLPKAVQDSHIDQGDKTLTGVCDITCGTSVLSRMVLWVFGFPPSGRNVPVRVVKHKTPLGETWTRHFGDHKLVSHLSCGPKGLREKFGIITFDIGLLASPKGLEYPVARGRMLGVPLPRFALPISITKEHEVEGRFHFDVQVYAPLTKAHMVTYKGWLT